MQKLHVNKHLFSNMHVKEKLHVNMRFKILEPWEAPSWRPTVCKNISYVDVKIREIRP
jgi:hypothetical protein